MTSNGQYQVLAELGGGAIGVVATTLLRRFGIAHYLSNAIRGRRKKGPSPCLVTIPNQIGGIYLYANAVLRKS